MAWKIGSAGGACALDTWSMPSPARPAAAAMEARTRRRRKAPAAAGRRLAGYPLGRAQDTIRMPLVLPTIGDAAEVCGADPRVCAGRPRPASGTTQSASCRVRQAAEGDRPTVGAGALSGKTSGIGIPSCPTKVAGAVSFRASVVVVLHTGGLGEKR